MTTPKLPERKHYLVVCKNEKQAGNLFERAITHFKTTTNARLMRVDKTEMIIARPIDTIQFISERQIDTIQFISERQIENMMLCRGTLNCTLVSWRKIDNRLNCMEVKK